MAFVLVGVGVQERETVKRHQPEVQTA
jgi:hypothetical protein